MTKDKIWNYIIDNCIATEEELKLVTCLNGYNEETLNDVIFARIGYRDIEQTEGEE